VTEKRFCDIEEKLAYQEHIVQTLNEVIYQQQKQIDRLELTCQQLADKVKNMDETGSMESVVDEKPPHY
jgi:SlyX protein